MCTWHVKIRSFVSLLRVERGVAGPGVADLRPLLLLKVALGQSLLSLAQLTLNAVNQEALVGKWLSVKYKRK